MPWFINNAMLLKRSFCLFPGMHINKALYTFSYTCLTAGAAGLFFAGTYLLVRFLIIFLLAYDHVVSQSFRSILIISKMFNISVITHQCPFVLLLDSSHFISVAQTSGWCLWHKATNLHFWVDGSACADDLFSNSMQHLASSNPGFLLERTREQFGWSYPRV